jgi:hypothetical protein
VEVPALVRRAYRLLERVLIGVVAAVAVLAAVISLRLMSGPIELDFLKPRIADALDTAGGKLHVAADHISLEWSGLSQPVRLVFKGIHVTDMDKKELATAPSVALSFAARSVFQGHLFPTTIAVEQPTFDAEIDREGGMLRRVLGKTDSSSQGEMLELLLEQLLAESNPRSLLGQLDTVTVERARVTLRDIPSGVVWTAPSVRASLKRDITGVIIAADARFSRPNFSEPVDMSLSGTYARDRSRVSVEMRIDGLKPLMFADYSPDVAVLGGIDIALSGKLDIDAGVGGEVHKVRMELAGGRGTVALPGILPSPRVVRSVSALGLLDTDSNIAKIDHVDVDLGTVKLSMTGAGSRTETGQSFSGRADIRDIPADRLGEYWPLGLVEGGRDWALANLSVGSVDVGAEFALSAPDDDLSDIKVDRMVALLDYRGMKIRYMPHMPELEGVSGKARYENDKMHFDMDGGIVVGLGVTGATVDLTNLDMPGLRQYASIHLPITGSAAQVMAMISRPQLGLPKDALFDPKRMAGDAAVMLDLRFPLINELAVGDVDIRVTTALSGLSIKSVVPDIDLTDGVGKLVYADDQLSISSQVKLDGNPVELNIRELFAPRSPYRRRYELKGTLPASLMAKAGLPSPEPYITGPVGATIVYQTQINGTSDVTGKFDLKSAKVDGGPIGWTKAPGVDASLGVGLKLAAAAKLLSADFDGKGDGLAARGQVVFAEGNTVQRVSLSQLVLGRSDFSLDWRRTATGADAALSGRSIELARVRQALKRRDEAWANQPGGATARAEGNNTRLSVKLDQFLLQHGTLGAVDGRLEIAGDRLAFADLSFGGGKGSALKVTPATGGRSIATFIPDVGLMLNQAGWLDGLVGGDLDFQGRFDDSTPESKLTGAVRVGPYRLVRVEPRPDIGSLNSTIDALNRAGNALQQFDLLEARVVKVGDRIDIAKGRTSGKSIGLTTEGTVDLGAETARLRGTVVPGFELNNLLSNVPLLGPLLTGGKDGGLFAFSYTLTGPLDDLKSDVNIMSAITPGALRELFFAPLGQEPAQEKPRATP